MDQHPASFSGYGLRMHACRSLSPVGPAGSEDWLRTRTWARHAARWQLLPTRAASSWEAASRVVVEQRCRDRAEMTMGRCMHLIGQKPHARSLPAQQVSVAIAAAVLDMWPERQKPSPSVPPGQRTGQVRSASARSPHQRRSEAIHHLHGCPARRTPVGCPVQSSIPIQHQRWRLRMCRHTIQPKPSASKPTMARSNRCMAARSRGSLSHRSPSRKPT